MNILQKITKTKLQEVAKAKQYISLDSIKQLAVEYKNPTRGFINAIKQRHPHPAVIAEIKKASPSKGVFCHDFDVQRIAKQYEQNNATCLSVLTDKEYFQGDDSYIAKVKEVCSLPILRKDFIIDEYQIYQSKILGADCILLIASILDKDTMKHFEQIAHSLNLDVLPEIHHHEELEKAYTLETPLLGINNRNLATFEVDLQQTIGLLPLIKDKIIVTESGILQKSDVDLMLSYDVRTFLVGEAFMKTSSPGSELKNIFS